MIIYTGIPKTELEAASSGIGQSRVIFIRTKGEVSPSEMVEGARVVLIGSPQSRLKRAFSAGLISRPILGELIGAVSGNTYSKIRQFIA